MKHLVFIVNPHSGVDRQKAIQQSIDECLDHTQFTYEIQHTQYAKHGTELAATAAAKNVYAVIAVGGDGSVADVAKGLTGTNTALAIVPKGSGNGLARSLNIPLDVRRAIAIINNDNSVRMDIGYANEHAFISNAGVGFDTVIAQQFALSRRRGLKAYSWLVMKSLWAYRVWDWKLTIDGEERTEQAFMITVANGQQFGYNFKIAPEASWTDGLFDVIIINKFPKILAGTLVRRAMNGTITKSPFVKRIKAKEIVVEHPELTLIQTDGDAVAVNGPVRFLIHPQALKVMIP